MAVCDLLVTARLKREAVGVAAQFGCAKRVFSHAARALRGGRFHLLLTGPTRRRRRHTAELVVLRAVHTGSLDRWITKGTDFVVATDRRSERGTTRTWAHDFVRIVEWRQDTGRWGLLA